VNFDLAKFDWAGAAAVGGVAVTALTALTGGLAAWGRVRRMERLVALAKELDAGSKQRLVLDAIVLDHAQRMDFRQRGPSQLVRTVLFWLSQVVGWAFLVGAYVVIVVALQQFTVPGSEAKFSWGFAGLLAAAVAVAVFLLVAGQQVRAGSLNERADWVGRNTPKDESDEQPQQGSGQEPAAVAEAVVAPAVGGSEAR